MPVPHLYRQLQTQISQWLKPQDQCHLQGFCENLAAILQAQNACLSHWRPYLSHRDCQARSHMERSYFVHNPNITSETFYHPLLQQFLKAWAGMDRTLTLDTRGLWGQYCLIEVCLVWVRFNCDFDHASHKKREHLETRIEFSRVTIVPA